jgi:V/A-type H+-transporting ATPase subunit D
VLSFGDIIEDLLLLAQIEKTCDMLSSEMEKTRRRVNALEHVIIPEMKRNIKYITMKLDDYERSNITRLMKVKEMVIKK